MLEDSARHVHGGQAPNCPDLVGRALAHMVHDVALAAMSPVVYPGDVDPAQGGAPHVDPVQQQRCGVAERDDAGRGPAYRPSQHQVSADRAQGRPLVAEAVRTVPDPMPRARTVHPGDRRLRVAGLECLSIEEDTVLGGDDPQRVVVHLSEHGGARHGARHRPLRLWRAPGSVSLWTGSVVLRLCRSTLAGGPRR